MTTETLFFHLLRCAICGEGIKDDALLTLSSGDLTELYALSNQHDLSHLVAHAIEGLSFADFTIYEKFKVDKVRSIYRYLRLDYNYKKICTILEQAGIPYLPLKGAVMRCYYPEPWMRTSCDIDILVKKGDLMSAVDAISNCGWIQENKRVLDHDLSFYSVDGVHLELHFSLAENMDNIDPILEQVWSYCVPVSEAHHEYRLCNDFFLFYHVAHMSHHFMAGGCGIRPFIDLWVLKNLGYRETTELRNLFKQARLNTFFDSVMELTEVLFDEKDPSTLMQQLEQYVLFGGTFGTLENKVLIDQVRSGNKTTNLRERIWQPYDLLSIYYPILKKYRCLYPLFQIVRWFRILMLGRLQRSILEFQTGNRISTDQLAVAKHFLKEIGLSEIKRNSL